jgi:hypothetical protein
VVNVSRYDAYNTPHALEFSKGLKIGEEALDIYLELVVIANNSLVENVHNALIKIYYRTADLDTNGDGYTTGPWDIDENQLTLYYFNETTGSWQKLTDDLEWVIEIGINTTDIELYGEHYAGYIWAIVTHLSLYGIGGHIIGLPLWVFFVSFVIVCIGIAFYILKSQKRRKGPTKALMAPKEGKMEPSAKEGVVEEGRFIRPIRYLLKREYHQTLISEILDLPLDAIKGLSSNDLPKFQEIGIDTIPKLAETTFSKGRDKGPSDTKLNHGISYAIDLMIHAEEPGIYDEIMPLEELLVKRYERTPGSALPSLDITAIEGLSENNAEKLRKENINLVKELAEVDIGAPRVGSREIL